MTDIKKLKYYINSQEKMINAIVSYLNGGMRNDLEVLKRIVEHLEEKPTEKAENKKCKEIIKRTVVENFNCSDCKELGLFDKCQKKEKSCDQIISDLFDEVYGAVNDNR